VALLLVALRPLDAGSVTPTVALLLVIATTFLLQSLPAIHAAQAEESGYAGLAGYVLLVPGLLLLVLVSATPILYPSAHLVPSDHPLLFILALALTAGLLLTALGMWRAAVLPRPAAALLLAGTVGFFFSFFIAETVTAPIANQLATAACGLALGAGFAWAGIGVWRLTGR